MTPFLLYIGRSSLYLALFYAFFLLVMRRTTFFRLNRILLLVGTLLCFLLPIVRLRTGDELLTVGPLTMAASDSSLTAGPSATSPVPYLEILYGIGFLAVLAGTVVALVRMHRTIRTGESRRLEDGTKLVLMETDIPSFSWGRTIVMSRKDAEQNPVILLHEKAHIQKGHTLDILIFTAVTLVHWFNPFVWIALSELKLLHEYEADDAVLDKGIDATQYQLLLVRKAVGDKRFTLANGFQHTKLKNRIEMMLKPSTSGWMRWSYLALIPVLAAVMFACNPKKNSKEEALKALEQETLISKSDTISDLESVPFSLIEQKPTFNGGDSNEFSKWVNSQLKYPEKAKKDGTQGRVTLQFTVGADGVVRDVKVLRGVREDLDAEALRVVSASPKWEPGVQDGKAVPVIYTFPIIFQLR